MHIGINDFEEVDVYIKIIIKKMNENYRIDNFGDIRIEPFKNVLEEIILEVESKKKINVLIIIYKIRVILTLVLDFENLIHIVLIILGINGKKVHPPEVL